MVLLTYHNVSYSLIVKFLFAAECFKDRTDVQCLHRWQKVLNPELVKGPWSKEVTYNGWFRFSVNSLSAFHQSCIAVDYIKTCFLWFNMTLLVTFVNVNRRMKLLLNWWRSMVQKNGRPLLSIYLDVLVSNVGKGMPKVYLYLKKVRF